MMSTCAAHLYVRKMACHSNGRRIESPADMYYRMQHKEGDRTGRVAGFIERYTRGNHMKKDRQAGVVVMAVITLLSVGLAGCDKSKETAPAATTAVETKQEAAQHEHPASAKPKDHPAH